jgi:hypothetical protein
MFDAGDCLRLVGMAPDKALQSDKGNLSYLLHSQKLRQLAFTAELDRYARDQQAEVNKWPRN